MPSEYLLVYTTGKRLQIIVITSKSIQMWDNFTLPAFMNIIYEFFSLR